MRQQLQRTALQTATHLLGKIQVLSSMCLIWFDDTGWNAFFAHTEWKPGTFETFSYFVYRPDAPIVKKTVHLTVGPAPSRQTAERGCDPHQDHRAARSFRTLRMHGGKRGLVAPQNTFLENIVRRSSGEFLKFKPNRVHGCCIGMSIKEVAREA